MDLTLYDYLPSGNGYKVRLTAKRLGLPYRLVEKDIKTGATRTSEFMQKNPQGRIPLLEIGGVGTLAESHAIIQYLADGSDLIPQDRYPRALMEQWLCFEQYELEPNVGTARFWLNSLKQTPAELGEKLVEKHTRGHAALKVLEQGLTGKRFLVADRFTLADISLFAYTHVAPEGGFSLEGYPAIRAWIRHVQAERGHAPITSA